MDQALVYLQKAADQNANISLAGDDMALLTK